MTNDLSEQVRKGLTASPKALPPMLFYDEEGSRLYERITELPEYYLTRAERSIFAEHAGELVARALDQPNQHDHLNRPLTVVELGAGSASKTEVLLAALLRRQPACLYVPVDVSAAALHGAARRLAGNLPLVQVRPIVATHEDALAELARLEGPVLVLFIGSSIGNLDDDAAERLLRGLRRALGPRAQLLLGTDLRKAPDVLIPAYDDAAGVTAAFNKNVLARINRELGGRFDPALFRHLARWNDPLSRIEMHLESVTAQSVPIEALGIVARFQRGETIHTESSVKYDLARVGRLLERGGFSRPTAYFDRERRFAVHLAAAAP